MESTPPKQAISLQSLIIRFRWRVSFTFALVIVESLLDVLYPLFIGLAIDGLLQKEYAGLIQLTVLGIVSLAFGTARRFYDTRIYSGIYCQILPEMVTNERNFGRSVSTISARSALLTEFVDFLENSMPEIVRGVVSLIGILVIIATLNWTVFFACLGILLLIITVYGVSGKTNYRLNANYNNQLEKQIEELESNDLKRVSRHYSLLMQWKIRLSDLETRNYLAIWIGVIALFVYTPLSVIEGGVTSYGLVSSIFMYVFNYVDSSIAFPFYIQQLIRLKEISSRLANSRGNDSATA
ncbi:ABC transporter six-transmembrane domain-containing protein [Thiothrix lacustris]|uniref:ABC transporter six-transmembrane domain-containing protein n=1 Tax=Thiothrix lacustris TaxID=525917 RepID=UPI0027E5195E|nr:ABC transporter six-transmembrane domain-containing protein [Thiothrix lacustris]WMP19422.1 ABC transporter six-transmembrane domain-containing protein [Thiothrix lacustris]